MDIRNETRLLFASKHNASGACVVSDEIFAAMHSYDGTVGSEMVAETQQPLSLRVGQLAWLQGTVSEFESDWKNGEAEAMRGDELRAAKRLKEDRLGRARLARLKAARLKAKA